MKKKILSILIALAVLMSCAFVVPTTDTYASAKAKYVKVKQATYNKMKKTIASQKKTIASQKKTITARNTTIANQKVTIANKDKIIAERDATIKDKKSTISWLWSTLEDFGFFYNYDSHEWEYAGEEQEPIDIDRLDMEDASDVIPFLEEQTGLTIDVVEIVDSWKAWYCYYVQADGDLYVVTVKSKNVDVVTQLN